MKLFEFKIVMWNVKPKDAACTTDEVSDTTRMP